MDKVPASMSGFSWSYFPRGDLFLWSRWLATFSVKLESLQRREFFQEPVLAAIAISKQEGGCVWGSNFVCRRKVLLIFSPENVREEGEREGGKGLRQSLPSSSFSTGYTLMTWTYVCIGEQELANSRMFPRRLLLYGTYGFYLLLWTSEEGGMSQN